MQIALFILAVILFIGLVLVHEWGHFIVARRSGVEAEEFGLGFPPRAYGKRLKSGLLISLNWLPLGGFVKLKGEHDSDTRSGSFGAASLYSKTKILLAGIGMNFLVGVVLLTILAAIGMPVLITKAVNGQDQFSVKSDTKIVRREVEVGYVLPGSPAAHAGLRDTDTIVSIAAGADKITIHSAAQLHDATKHFAGQAVSLTYKRSGQTLQKAVILLGQKEVTASLSTPNPKGYLGIEQNELIVQRSTWSAPIVALGLTKQLVWLTLQGLGHAIGGLGSVVAGTATGNHTARVNGQNQAESQVGGPVAIMKILWSSGSLGLNFVLAFIAIISLSLALINVLPIPALDGGRLAMSIFSRVVLKRPFSRSAEERIVGTGMAIVIGLIILITIVDVKRFY